MYVREWVVILEGPYEIQQAIAVSMASNRLLVELESKAQEMLL